jgi:lipopolysaccharide/colanic/teichoic acid biosynthesis glycosyltransferase
MKDVPEGTVSSWTVTDADRYGRFGRFMRTCSLDEIPHLINVFDCDMSLVGPRPERPKYVNQFSGQYKRYGHRHRVPVGLTGLAAVEGLRGDASIADSAYLDHHYMENWSLWLDTRIAVRTLLAARKGTGE